MSKVELKKKWWITTRPKTAKGAELEKALGLVEDADEKKRSAALAGLSPAISKARAELEKLDKKANKGLIDELATLEKMADAEIKALQAAEAKAKVAAKAAEKAAEKSDKGESGDDEEPTEDKMFDPEVHRTVLKRATRQPLVFAFSVSTKAENRVLALGVRGIPMSYGRLAKARGGGAKVVFGWAQAAPGEGSKLVLALESAEVPGTVKALRMYLKENKITLFRKFATMVGGKESESESEDDDAPAGDTPEQAAKAAPAAAAVAPELAAAAGAKAAAPATPAEAAAAAAPAEAASPEQAPTQQQMEVLQDRRKEFKRARAAWVTVKARAEQDLEKVKDGVKMAYMADAAQFPKVVAGCKQIDQILDNLDDELRDTLDLYASTPLRNQKKLQGLADTAKEVLDRYHTYVNGNAMMRAIDEKEFADVVVHAPVTKALADLRKALA